MKERPILFSAPMVRALLDGTKTQTRRVVKPQPDFDTAREALGRHVDDSCATYDPLFRSIGLRDGAAIGFVQPNIACKYGQPGDRLWVKETWRTVAGADDIAPRDLMNVESLTHYEADGNPVGMGKLRPSMFMPRWASRITMEIIGVRVERLNDISEGDVIMEGCQNEILYGRGWYRDLWESLNGLSSWDANPWVWVVEFKKQETENAARQMDPYPHWR